jgi:predicted esterase
VSLEALVALATTLAAPLPPTEQPLARGTVIEKVACTDDKSQSYALYLPAAYAPERRWPILYVLDARGRGAPAAERFREAAERYGYLVASSNNSRSDEAVDPNTDAMRAMWRDTHTRLSVDDRRVYAAGFSGGARAAIRLAALAPGTIAGVIACGAGFPPELPPAPGLGFGIFGVAGETDFNYEELQALDARLAELEVPHRVESFEGAHEWPPPEVCRQAVEWMEVRAIKEGRRGKDEVLLETLLATGLEAAARLEASGRVLDAARAYEALERDFGGLRDVAAARQSAARLRGTAAHAQAVKTRAGSLRREREYIARAPSTLGQLSPEGGTEALRRTLSELRISELRKSAAEATDREERLMARRLLESVFVQTSFYLPRALLERKEPRRAALTLQVAAEIKPEEPYVWYALARARALSGEKGDALNALRRAVEAGFRDAEALGSEPGFEALRKERGYLEILESLRRAPGRAG